MAAPDPNRTLFFADYGLRRDIRPVSDADDMLRELELKIEECDVLIAEIVAAQINMLSANGQEEALRSLRGRRARFQAAADTLKAAIAAQRAGD
jgi:hypothetical protein